MPPRSWAEIEKAIARELHQRPEKSSQTSSGSRSPRIDRAGASAQLHDGREVAVKVQYPDIETLVATDLTVLEQIVKAIARLAPSIELRPILDYLKETLPLELDFRHEAGSMARLRAAFAHRSDVVIPALFRN